MKRTVALAILGLAVVGATTTYGQGFIQFSNYASPYVPITFGGTAVGDGQGVTASVWAAPGNVGEGALLFIDNASTLSQGGFDGYTSPFQAFTLPGYTSGQTWTIQLRAEGTLGGQPVFGAGPLVVTSDIGDGTLPQPELPVFNYTPGFELAVVPEPSTFALAGLGAAALLIFRRRD